METTLAFSVFLMPATKCTQEGSVFKDGFNEKKRKKVTCAMLNETAGNS